MNFEPIVTDTWNCRCLQAMFDTNWRNDIVESITAINDAERYNINIFHHSAIRDVLTCITVLVQKNMLLLTQ